MSTTEEHEIHVSGDAENAIDDYLGPSRGYVKTKYGEELDQMGARQKAEVARDLVNEVTEQDFGLKDILEMAEDSRFPVIGDEDIPEGRVKYGFGTIPFNKDGRVTDPDVEQPLYESFEDAWEERQSSR